jgi:hypothetical protein
MPRRAVAHVSLTVVAATALAALAAGCGKDDRPLPAACTEGPAPVIRALERAPGPVRLADGTPLSACVQRARSDADIQAVGAVFTHAADGLAGEMRTSDAAALRLGYLIAAVRKGGRHTSGIHEEMVRRVEQTVGLDGAPPPRKPAFAQGLAAGERSG